METSDLQKQLTQLREQQDRLLNLRLLDVIDKDTFASRNTERRDRIAAVTLHFEDSDRSRAKTADVGIN